MRTFLLAPVVGAEPYSPSLATLTSFNVKHPRKPVFPPSTPLAFASRKRCFSRVSRGEKVADRTQNWRRGRDASWAQRSPAHECSITRGRRMSAVGAKLKCQH